MGLNPINKYIYKYITEENDKKKEKHFSFRLVCYLVAYLENFFQRISLLYYAPFYFAIYYRNIGLSLVCFFFVDIL